MVSRIIIVGALIAVMFLWLGPFSVPNCAVIGFVFVVLFPLGIVLNEADARGEPLGTHALPASDARSDTPVSVDDELCD